MTKNNKKKSIVIKFPSLFTINELQSLYPDTPEITLRYKTGQAKERGTVVELGKIPRDIGRPTKIYATSPVNDTIKQSAIDIGTIFETE